MKLKRINPLSFNTKVFKKLVKIMKLTSIFILILTLHASANVWSQNSLSVKMQNSSLLELFTYIENNSDYKFFYNNDEVDVQEKVSLEVEDKTINQVLNEAFKELPYSYKEVGNKLILIETKEKRSVNMNQQTDISGKVMDSSGTPLPGVSIVIKGTTTGTITNTDGNFTLPNVAANATLVFSFVGMLTQEVEVAGQSSINITMEADAIGIEEVVAIGYGTKSRATLAGTVSEVKGEYLLNKPITNVSSGLQGAAPGLVVTRDDGQPGREGVGLQIRGISTWHDRGSSPLVLIDGLEGSLNDLHPNDIENFIVLKDASAAIYGARASNGVILVTTQKGKKGDIRVKLSSYVAVKTPTTIIEQSSVRQLMEMHNEYRKNDDLPELFTKEYFDALGTDKVMPFPIFEPDGPNMFAMNMKGTNWADLVYGNGFQHSHNISISGGGDKTSYLLSLGYFDEDGIVIAKHDSYKKYNMRLNYNYDISDKIKLETKTSVVRSITDEMHHLYRSLDGVLLGWNVFPERTLDGTKPATMFGNIPQVLHEKGNIIRWNNTFNTNFKLNIDILPELRWVNQAGVEYKTGDSREIVRTVYNYHWKTSEVFGVEWGTSPNSLTLGFSKSLYRNLTSYFDFKKEFGDHDVSVMAGASHEDFDTDNFSAWRRNFGNEKVFSLELGDSEQQYNSQPETDSNDNPLNAHWAIESLFSRVGYIYKNRYILEANLRYDGSSRFHPDTRWGFFKGVLGSWRASDESFVKDLGIFDELKFKVSWGETGNQSGIGLYDYIPQINVGGSYPFGGGTKAVSAWQAGMVSLDRTWETVQTQNIGVEATVLNNRLSVSYDYFIKRNKDMLIPVTYPAVLGSSAPYSNNGELKTWGFEATVNWKDKVGEFDYYVSAFVSDNQNELVNLGGIDAYEEGLVRAREGYPLNSVFGYVWDGIIQNDTELAEYKKIENIHTQIGVGDARYKDVDGNGKMDAFGDKSKGEAGDLVYLGTTNPRYSFGIQGGANFKGFDFAFAFQGIGKRTYFRTGNEVIIPFGQMWRQPLAWHYGKTWTPERTDARYPRLTSKDVRYWNYRISENTKVNARYIRLKNITLGYTIPKSVTQQIGIDKLRVYFSGQDLWQTYPEKGTGYDPEAGTSYTYYPFSSTYSFGIDLTF